MSRGMLRARTDEIDVQIEKISHLIEGGARQDPELGAGLGCTESLTSVERKIDTALAVVEELDRHVTDISRAA